MLSFLLKPIAHRPGLVSVESDWNKDQSGSHLSALQTSHTQTGGLDEDVQNIVEGEGFHLHIRVDGGNEGRGLLQVHGDLCVGPHVIQQVRSTGVLPAKTQQLHKNYNTVLHKP